MHGVLAESTSPHEVLNVILGLSHLTFLRKVILYKLRRRMEPAHEVEPHWEKTKGTFSLAMDEPCLHVPHDHLHLGQALIPPCREENILIHLINSLCQ
jgi:hypothetical protein